MFIVFVVVKTAGKRMFAVTSSPPSFVKFKRSTLHAESTAPKLKQILAGCLPERACVSPPLLILGDSQLFPETVNLIL